MIVLCQGCGMSVLTKPDGTCPSCGASGEVVVRIQQGRKLQVLLPAEPKQYEYACLYLRPFAVKFRAAARMRAVAHAMRPFGKTAALPEPSDRQADRVKFRDLPSSQWLLLYNVLVIIANLFVRFRRRGVEVVGDIDDESWRTTFRQLASKSKLIVMDASTAARGVAYEADYLESVGLVTRLVIIHEASMHVAVSVEHLRHEYPTISVIPYSKWRLNRLTSDLREAVRVRTK
jgi:hypothetical protein